MNMTPSIRILACAMVALAGCEDVQSTGTGPFITPLPEGVLAIAGPFQNLDAVKIEPSDGCYVYRHVGPVETTFLPLRSKTGAPICSRPAEPAAPAAPAT